MSLRDRKYKENQTIISLIGTPEHRKIKVVTLAWLRTKGIENEEEYSYVRKGTVNDEKLSANISRARTRIFELAFCNSWDYFCTFTFDKTKHSRSDLELIHKHLTQFFRDFGKTHQCKIGFLLVPELHADGQSWHLHGLIKGLPVELLHQFQVGDSMGKVIAYKVKNGFPVFNWLEYQEKFGFCDLEPVRNEEAVAKYMTKYISKALGNSVSEIGAHLFYRSRGLYEPQKVKTGTLSHCVDLVPDFQNEFFKTSTLEYSQDLLQTLIDNIAD